MRLKIPGPAGQLEAKIDEPTGTPRAVVVLAHPHPEYGGTMCHKVVFRVAKALQNIGCTVLRFNFRGTGTSEGRFDGKDGEHEDFFASLDFAAARHPKLDLWAAGFSFGAWVALTAGALDSRVRALIGVAPPIENDTISIHYSEARNRSSSSKVRKTKSARWKPCVAFTLTLTNQKNWL